MKLFELLEKHTSEKGSYTISFNDHKSVYQKPQDYYFPFMEEDEILETTDIDWTKNIYELHWYKDTPVGFYRVFGNNIKEIEKKVREIVGCEE